MMRGLCLYLECGTFMRENWRIYHRVSEAAKVIRDSGDKDWKRHVTFEHVRPLNNMYKMLLDERATLTVDRAAVIIGEIPADPDHHGRRAQDVEARLPTCWRA